MVKVFLIENSKEGVEFSKQLLNGKLTPKARLCEREWSADAGLWA